MVPQRSEFRKMSWNLTEVKSVNRGLVSVGDKAKSQQCLRQINPAAKLENVQGEQRNEAGSLQSLKHKVLRVWTSYHERNTLSFS